MTWSSRTQKIKVGDTVAICHRHLRSIGRHTADMTEARGTIKELKQAGEMTIAVVDWGAWEIEPKVNSAYLSRVTERGVMDEW